MRARPAPPPRTYRRKRWQEVEFAALDFETTGLDLRRDAVVSFGIVPILGGRIHLSEAVYQEVAPPVPVSHVSVTVHHIRPVELAGAPPLEDVLESLGTALEGRYLLAWPAEIEATFLARSFGPNLRRWLSRTIDVLRLAVLADRIEGQHLPEGAYALSEAVTRAGLPVEEAHNALNDALMTAELFLVIAARLSSRGFGDVRSFLRATPASRLGRPRGGGFGT